MNSSKKYIYPLFESVCVIDGSIQNAVYHNQRFYAAYQQYYLANPPFALFDGISIPQAYQKGTTKLRIAYNKTGSTHSFTTYHPKKIKSLQLVVDDQISYNLKQQDRTALTALYNKRKTQDDVLIIKNNLVTDTYFANIIFWDGRLWHTPNSYLLKGTKRTQLLAEKKIVATPIYQQDLYTFKGFQLINAMLGFKPDVYLPINNIVT